MSTVSANRRPVFVQPPDRGTDVGSYLKIERYGGQDFQVLARHPLGDWTVQRSSGIDGRRAVLPRRDVATIRHSPFERESVSDRFRRLATQWYRNRPRFGDVHEICAHPVYLEIIGIGPEVVPYILEELRRRPEHWFVALRALVPGQGPQIPDEARGKMKRLAELWVEWGKRNEFID